MLAQELADVSLCTSFAIGDLQVSALSDGVYPRLLEDLFTGARADEWTKAAGLAEPNEQQPFNIGCFVVRSRYRTIVVDTGVGGLYGRPAAGLHWGELTARLQELGVAPGQVDTVVHTHLHWDHCGWDIDDANGGALLFRNAHFYVSKAELDYWLTGPNTGEERGRRTRSRIEPLVEKDLVVPVSGEFSVSPEVTMIPTPGHTPGHCSVLVASRGAALILAGDAAYHRVHIEHPNWMPAIEHNALESRASRLRLFALATALDAIIMCSHMPTSSVGRIRRAGEQGYRWVDASLDPPRAT